MADNVEINITATENVSETLGEVQDSAQRTERVVVQTMGSTEEAFDTAARGSGRFGAALDTASGASSQLAGGIGDLGDGMSGLTELQNASANRARELARSQNDVEQAMVDTEQAAIDLKQAQLDLTQSALDGKQANIDSQQAVADAGQAMIDAEAAQTAYNEAVKEHGPTSIEAKQAAADLKQAQIDLNQANLDAEQATADKAQAEADATQATADMKQANVDAKGSALDLAEAQQSVKDQSSTWNTVASQAALVAPVIMGVVGAIDLMILANTALSASNIRTTATTIGSTIATGAATIGMGIATAATWAFNTALAVLTSPITLIIVAVVALVAGIVWLATQTQFFQTVWAAIWGTIGEPVKAAWEWIKSATTALWNFMVGAFNGIKDAITKSIKAAVDFGVNSFNFFMSIPDKIGNAFNRLGGMLLAPFRWAFNAIASGWNNTVGRLSFTIPGWVPGMGGNGFSMPRIPYMATGGDILRDGVAFLHKGERVMPASKTGLGATGSGGAIEFIVSSAGGSGNEFADMFLKMLRSGGITLTTKSGERVVVG